MRGAEDRAATLVLYNTRTHEKEPFRPIDPARVRMYVCGPTVYDEAHIGNARPVIVFDVLYRLLRHVYGAAHVTYVRNITDVDDKINARAARDHPDLPLNEAIRRVTARTAAQFEADVAALGCLRPDVEPRATDHIEEMRAIIERLVARGVAYVADGHVLFSVPAMARVEGVPAYGSLARRSLDEMVAGARVDVASYKRDEMDFVLWKPSSPGEPGWPSPAGIDGLGRPGWHIECSAMAWKHLVDAFAGRLACTDAQAETFDIHGGGIDLVFPHHENEVAQTCCAFGIPRMANVWMHNGFLQVEGEKMSKSLGNFVTIADVLKDWPGEVARLAMLKTHYRQPIDWTVRGLEETWDELSSWAEALRLRADAGLDFERRKRRNASGTDTPLPTKAIVDALADDLNTPAALAALRELFARVKKERDLSAAVDLLESCEFLGLLRFEKLGLLVRNPPLVGDGARIATPQQRDLIYQFAVASANSSAAAITALVSVLQSDGVSVTINPLGDLSYRIEGSGGLSREQIQQLVDRRKAARAAKDWAESDRLRELLTGMGVTLKDTKDDTHWEPSR
ncbi:MAG: cysteine--tRNA ligase [Salinarimonas sp.]